MQATRRRIIAPFVVSLFREAGNAQPRRQAASTELGCDSKTTLIKPGRPGKLTSAKKKTVAAQLSDKPILAVQKLNKDSGVSLHKLLGPETSTGRELQPILLSRLQSISQEDERL